MSPQFLDHKDTGDFLIYYTRPHLSGTEDFEHKVYVNLSRLKYFRDLDDAEDRDHLVVECPCGCGLVATVPLLGGEDAQELHAHHRGHVTGRGYREAAREIAEEVERKGGIPRVGTVGMAE